jgi:hypothetical protein
MDDRAPPVGRRPTRPVPCPPPEDRLLCPLIDLQTYPLQVVQGRLFGMGHSKAHQWMHVLLVVRRVTQRALGDAPTRSVQELAQRLGVAEAKAAALVMPTARSSPPADSPAAAPAPASPLLGPMGRNGASRAPRIRLSKRAVIAARKDARR